MQEFQLSAAQKAQFSGDGVLVLRDFYDIDSEVRPIQHAIYEIIGLIIKRHDLNIDRKPYSSQSFDDRYADLLAFDRKLGAEVYDAIKQIPAFIRLISSRRSESLFSQLRGTDLAGIGAASYGIRIDNPFEEMYRSQWHQEFLFQPQSMDGLVLWTPLVPIEEDMGPVVVCRGSHRDGLQKVSKQGGYAGKEGAYKIGILDDEKVAARYEQVAPLTKPGDLIVMDFLTIHQSGFNISNRSRWSVQSRFFNFREPNGMKIGWKPSVTAGTAIEKIFSEYFEEGGL